MSSTRLGLIGSTGFVGSLLREAVEFDASYNSRSIAQIAGEKFGLLICAGAPAAMWAANARPEEDAANLTQLFAHMQSAEVSKLVLISTIAVFDDPSGGYTETSARFETEKAYGRNRRRLEEQVADAFDVHILRLPALFGHGLKKNFIFDLLHPVPSFVKDGPFKELLEKFSAAQRDAASMVFSFDVGLGMWKCCREKLAIPLTASVVEGAFREQGFLASSFTNSESQFQYYNVNRLWSDIQTCLSEKIPVLNVCSAPLSAREIHQRLCGSDFSNAGPALNTENVRTEYAEVFGQSGPYLIGRDAVLSELEAFFKQESRLR